MSDEDVWKFIGPRLLTIIILLSALAFYVISPLDLFPYTQIDDVAMILLIIIVVCAVYFIPWSPKKQKKQKRKNT